jgi:hypothetical protein
MPNNGGNTTPAQRIQAMALAEAGIEKKIAAASAGMTVSSVYRVIKKAKDRGYNKNESSVMKMEYVVDKPRSGRPEVTYGPAIGPSGRRYQRRKAGRRPGGSEVEVDEVEVDEAEVDEMEVDEVEVDKVEVD